uniref:Small polypeptide ROTUNDIFOLIA LIKE 1 n=1 Tax=Oryza sativa subsp. japonica TaxID=39947 RepID=RTFL1_ORYSJ|nr:RecName: Full=Small polypeptide ROTUNDIFOLIA LIKE 1; Short=OsRTFL1; Short=Small polypeptide ROT-FOUR-LIKE 1 [Oryza sativa Japonica Group]
MRQCASASSSTSRPPEAAGEEGKRRRRRRGWLLQAAAREQRSRFYIFRRCVAMLLCWYKYRNITPYNVVPLGIYGLVWFATMPKYWQCQTIGKF